MKSFFFKFDFYLIGNLSKLISNVFFLLGNQKNKLPFIFILFLINSSIDLIGLSFLYPYILIILDTNNEFNHILSSYINLEDYSFFTSYSSKIYIFSFMLLLIFILKFSIALYCIYIINKFSFDQAINIRSKLLNRYYNIPFEIFIKKNTSQYLNVLNNVAGDYQAVIVSILRIFNDFILAISLIIFLMVFNFYFTSLIVIVFLIIFILYNSLLKNRLTLYGKKINHHANLFIKNISESISGYREIKILNKENYFHDIINSHSIIFSKYKVIFSVISSMPKYFLELVLSLLIILIIFYYQYFQSADPDYIITTLAMFLFVSLRLFPSISLIIASISRLHFRTNSISIILDELNLDQISRIKTNKKVSFKKLIFNNVSFEYSPSKKIFKNINLEIKRNEIVGIKGSSGRGKTTLINLIIGFLKPSSGKIVINDNDNLNDIRNIIGYLPQDVFLIDDTILKNIALGENSSEISISKVLDSIKKSNLSEFVDSLPEKLETIIGDKGVKISGGQKQRLAIARALYFNREILILDESTSSLDKKTEAKIIDEILLLKDKITIILISHDSNLLNICDNIIDIDI